jgi:hypothetical protein
VLPAKPVAGNLEHPIVNREGLHKGSQGWPSVNFLCNKPRNNVQNYTRTNQNLKLDGSATNSLFQDLDATGKMKELRF